MKKMKKIFALLIAMVIVLGMSITAFAEASLTIDGAYEGETYTYYKLLNYTQDASGNYRYYTNETQAAALETALGFTFSKDGDDYVLNNAKDFEGKAEEIVNKLKALVPNVPNIGTDSKEAKDGTAAWSSLTDGLYFVTTTTGSICTLQSGKGDTIIVEKQEPSTVEKTATTPTGDGTASVGDDVSYTVTINAKKGETVVFKDILSTGLTLNGTAPTVTGITGHTVDTWNTNAGNGTDTSIQITFPVMTADTTITVTYSAKINSDALTLDTVKNKATLSWGNNQNTEATPAEVEVKLFKFTINKIDGNTKEALEGVEFTVQNSDNKYYDGSTVWADNEPATALTSDANGNITVTGIAAGTYTITETKAKDGYNKLEEPITVVVAADGTFTVTGATGSGTATQAGNATVTIENNSGSVLPSTGGIGTTIFYIVGAILVIGAGVVLVTRRRMNVQ